MTSGALAAVLNAGALSAPVVCFAPHALGEGHVIAVLVIASLFAFVEASGQTGCDKIDRVALVGPAATGIAMLTLLWTGLLTRGSVSASAVVLGALVMMLGIGLRRAAMRALGPRFVSEVRATPPSALEIRGVYARMRHPSETGILAVVLGASIVLASAAAVALWAALLVPLVIVRVRREEAQLSALFGQSYARYTRRVRMLL